MALDPKTIKRGDQVFVAYLAWGRMPTLNKVTVKTIGAKQMMTVNHGAYDIAKTSFYATKAEAAQHLRACYVTKLEEAKADVKAWEERIAEIDAAIVLGAEVPS